MEDFRVKPSGCPYCGASLDSVTATEKDSTAPQNGDITICTYCVNWLVFDDEKLRPISEEEIAALPDELFLTLTRSSRMLGNFINMERKVKAEVEKEMENRKAEKEKQ